VAVMNKKVPAPKPNTKPNSRGDIPSIRMYPMAAPVGVMAAKNERPRMND